MGNQCCGSRDTSTSEALADNKSELAKPVQEEEKTADKKVETLKTEEDEE